VDSPAKYSKLMADLVAFLEMQAPGAVDRDDLVRFLYPAWDDLGGGREESMSADKLRRLENPLWKPPVLEFALERHGGTVLGSSRGDVHHWAVDITTRTATIVWIGRRQLRPMDARLNVPALVDELTGLIEAGVDDPRLAWSADKSQVQIMIGAAIPETYRETTRGRRKRFAAAFSERAAEKEWEEVKRYTYIVR
jgi:hypothetical protein